MWNVTDRRQTDGRNAVPIARPLVLERTHSSTNSHFNIVDRSQSLLHDWVLQQYNGRNCIIYLKPFLPRDALQSAVLRSHVVCLSVRPSVRLWRWWIVITYWNSSKIISPLVSTGRSLFATLTWRVCSKGNTPKFGPKVTHPLLI